MKWQYFPSVGIKAPLHQWDMSHYGLLLDLAKMYDGRSRAAFETTTRKTMTTAVPLQLLLLLLALASQSMAMSLDRLALERNELPAPPESQPSPSPTVVVDDMKMAALPAQGATDMYMLVPESVASQLDDTEHVHRNTIEETAAEAAAEAENAAVGESADMLMLESDDTPAMQLVELPSDVTVAELKPETEPQSEIEPVAAEIASPELIEEHVVEQPAEQSAEQVQPQSSSHEAQLENAETLAVATTDAVPAIEEMQADDEAEPATAEVEYSTPAAEAEQIVGDVIKPEDELEQPQASESAETQPEPVKQLADEEPKLETAEAAENEVDTTEPSSILESMAEGIEQGLSAAMNELLPEEVSAAEAEAEADVEPEATQPQQDEQLTQETINKAEQTPAEQPAALEPQTDAVELMIESATEQIQQEAQPEVSNDVAEEPTPEQSTPEESQNDAETPAESPEEIAAETPVQTPVETPADNPVETLVEIPDNTQVETLVDTIVDTPVEAQADTPDETPAEAPAEIAAETPAEALDDAPAETPEAAPAETPVEAELEPAAEVANVAETQTSEEAAIKPIEPEMEKESEQAADELPQDTEKLTEILADKVHEPTEPQAEAQPEPQAEAQPEQQEEILADAQAEPETEPAAVPQVESQAELESVPAAEPQAAPELTPQAEPQAEQAEPQAEVPAQPEQSILTTIIPAAIPQMSVAQPEPEPEPIQVMDSVLNYVNASFMQQQPVQQDQVQDMAPEPETITETPFNAQLRRYDGAQVWRIVVQTDKDKKLADELQSKYDGQLWKEVKQEVDYLLKPQVLAAAERHIRAANLSRIVLIDNLQQVIEVENPPAEKIAELQNRKGHRLTWQAYHRLEDIHGFIDYMAKTYPDICSSEIIGYSVEKRPLKILKISNGNAKNPGIWLDGGMHAREWISPATVTYIANQLVEGWEDLPEHMRNINWYIHPVANPDGYEYSHTTDRLWRKNMRAHGRQCPGVDLNRNFGYKWGGKGTSASPCSQTYRGSKAFSEPETFYISKFISGFPRNTFQAYLSFHSYGQYILYPWGFDYTHTKDRSDLDRVARQAGSIITKSSGVKYTVGSSATTLYPAAGGSDDWAKGIAGIKYAYTIEMGDTGRYGFVLPAQFIQYNGKDGYTFADTVARAVIQGRAKDARSSSSSSRRRRVR